MARLVSRLQASMDLTCCFKPQVSNCCFCIISGLLLWAACVASVRGVPTESLEEKLATVTDYVPKATSPVDQLVEVARRYKIPMGIEWSARENAAPSDKAPTAKKRTVKELIEQIASVSPEHCVVLRDFRQRTKVPRSERLCHTFNPSQGRLEKRGRIQL